MKKWMSDSVAKWKKWQIETSPSICWLKENQTCPVDHKTKHFLFSYLCLGICLSMFFILLNFIPQIARIVFPSSFVLFNLVYWIYYSVSGVWAAVKDPDLGWNKTISNICFFFLSVLPFFPLPLFWLLIDACQGKLSICILLYRKWEGK